MSWEQKTTLVSYLNESFLYSSYISLSCHQKKRGNSKRMGVNWELSIERKTLTWIGRHCSLWAKDDQKLASGYLTTIYEEQMFLNMFHGAYFW